MKAKKSIALGLGLVCALGSMGVTYFDSKNENVIKQAKSGVEELGLTDIRLKFSYAATFIRCGRNDHIGYAFTAKNTQKQKDVSGYVCTSLLRGPSVRW